MPQETDEQLIRTKHNTSRFFVEHRQIAWAALIGVVIWGVYGYFSMPQRKDPDIPVRVAVAVCQWPGATAQEVEQLVTRPIEQTIAENKTIHPAAPEDYGIRSISLPGVSFVYVNLAENVSDTKEQFSDINLKLQTLAPQLPSGTTGIQFQSDFGDTAALMMTVASPLQDDFAIEIRARSVEDAIRRARTASRGSKVSLGASPSSTRFHWRFHPPHWPGKSRTAGATPRKREFSNNRVWFPGAASSASTGSRFGTTHASRRISTTTLQRICRSRSSIPILTDP